MAETGDSQDKSRGCLRAAIACNQGDETIDELMDVLA